MEGGILPRAIRSYTDCATSIAAARGIPARPALRAVGGGGPLKLVKKDKNSGHKPKMSGVCSSLVSELITTNTVGGGGRSKLS